MSIKTDSLKRFKYLKDLVENDKEMHSALTFLHNKREDKCKNVFLDRETSKALGLRMGSNLWSLLAMYDEHKQS